MDKLSIFMKGLLVKPLTKYESIDQELWEEIHFEKKFRLRTSEHTNIRTSEHQNQLTTDGRPMGLLRVTF